MEGHEFTLSFGYYDDYNNFETPEYGNVISLIVFWDKSCEEQVRQISKLKEFESLNVAGVCLEERQDQDKHTEKVHKVMDSPHFYIDHLANLPKRCKVEVPTVWIVKSACWRGAIDLQSDGFKDKLEEEIKRVQAN